MTQDSRPLSEGGGGFGDRPSYGSRPPFRPGAAGPGGGAGRPPNRGPGGPRGRGRFVPRRKVCIFCVDHADSIDYKNYSMLRRFLSDRAKIEPRRKTGTCALHQRMVAQALQRARHIALLPFISDNVAEARPQYAPRSYGDRSGGYGDRSGGYADRSPMGERSAPAERPEAAELSAGSASTPSS